LTVHFVNVGKHKEHYPGLVDYRAEQRSDGSWVAHLEFLGSRRIVDENPCFHWGAGKTLEVRLFNRTRLEEEVLGRGLKPLLYTMKIYLNVE